MSSGAALTFALSAFTPARTLKQPSQKTFKIKMKLAKKANQNRPIPHWCVRVLPSLPIRARACLETAAGRGTTDKEARASIAAWTGSA